MKHSWQQDLNAPTSCTSRFLLRFSKSSPAAFPSFVPNKRWGFVVYMHPAHPLHLMEKPCHVSQDLVHSAAPHARHKSAVVKHWETWPILHGVVYLQPRPDSGLMSVNMPLQPGGSCPRCWNQGSLLQRWDCCLHLSILHWKRKRDA